jgi:beta-fructofuranosidase
VDEDTHFAIFAPTDRGYEKDDWRDPFVYWDKDANEFRMLLAARKSTGPTRNRGCTALMGSNDLRDWQLREPFWAPDEYFTHECPDLFRMGDWWYLIFSEFSDRCQTRYRMSRSLRGPWICPPDDCFDTRAYYAAKTASDGERRFIFGWLPTRKGEKDDGNWEWGGDLVVHEVVQRPDGTLRVQIPDTVDGRFNRTQLLMSEPRLGDWTVTHGSASASSVGRFSVLTLGEMRDPCIIETQITFSESTASCGLLLRCDEMMEKYVQVRLEPSRQRIVVDRYPRPGDQPFMLERPLPSMRAGKAVHLRAIADGTCLVVYADNEIAMSCRMYEHARGEAGLFAAEGDVAFGNLSVRSISPAQSCTARSP